MLGKNKHIPQMVVKNDDLPWQKVTDHLKQKENRPRSFFTVQFSSKKDLNLSQSSVHQITHAFSAY